MRLAVSEEFFAIGSDGGLMKWLFSTTAPGVGGRIKRRYADFIVEERTLEGRLCKVEFLLEENPPSLPKLLVPSRQTEKPYLHVDMEKKNTELHFAIRQLARYLHISNKRIGYAGIKDKRAVTCQRISIWKPPVERLTNFRKKLIVLKNPEWSALPIDLGDLKSNRFTVTIRDIDLSREEIEKRLHQCFGEMKKQGIANYFGEQRFGGIRNITHLVGRCIIKNKMKDAAMLFLTAVSDKEEPGLQQARKHLASSGDFKAALKEFPVKCRYERAMLHHLSIHPNDYVGAFQKLPKRIRILFTHAYQAYLFNEILSERLRSGLGLKRIDDEPAEHGVPLGLLPGYDSAFSPGRVGEIERAVLDREGVRLEDFRVRQMPECSSAGSRRPILVFPEGLEILEITEDLYYPNKNCCKLRFELPHGCYATVLLRELMKKQELE
jgi:tRNA pseudouridine13 synthase